jgi:hypothetical protein
MPMKIRNYKQEYKTSKERGEQDGRVQRNKARRLEERAGNVHKGDGKDVDHKRPISKGGKTTPGNLRVVSEHTNRSYARTRSGSMK